MHYLMKLTILIIILYLKLNVFNTIPLIEPIAMPPLHSYMNENDDSYVINNNNNNSNNNNSKNSHSHTHTTEKINRQSQQQEQEKEQKQEQQQQLEQQPELEQEHVIQKQEEAHEHEREAVHIFKLPLTVATTSDNSNNNNDNKNNKHNIERHNKNYYVNANVNNDVAYINTNNYKQNNNNNYNNNVKYVKNANNDNINNNIDSVIDYQLIADKVNTPPYKSTKTILNNYNKNTNNKNNHNVAHVMPQNYYAYDLIQRKANSTNSTATLAEAKHKLQAMATTKTPAATATATTAVNNVNTSTAEPPNTHNKEAIKNFIKELPQYLKFSQESPDEDGLMPDINEPTIVNNSDLDRILLKYEADGANKCLLDGIKDELIWWAYGNGSLRSMDNHFSSRSSYLDLSHHNATDDDSLYFKARQQTILRGPKILAFSAANNNLTRAPYRTLTLMNTTLKYLTLKGNQFASYTPEMQRDALNRIMNESSYRHPESNASTIDIYVYHYKLYHSHTHSNTNFNYCNSNHTTQQQQLLQQQQQNTQQNASEYSIYEENYKKLFGRKEQGIAWATFPLLPALQELDISNCYIEFVTSEAFQNLTNLRRLYLAHNKMLTIPFDTFQHVPKLQYLDLSFTNVLDYNYQIPLPTLDAIVNLIYGVKIQQTTFKHLPELVYLDLSHTKMTRNSAVAFTHLSEKLKYLSLCYTSFPMVGNAIFKNTALKALDLSGNPYAAYNILDDAFEGVADTLNYLYFERSNIKELSWLKYLAGLRVLSLAGNNMNSVSLETFSPLRSLQVLDLSSNHIGNWYNRAFTNNPALRVLNMRDNNINIITTEMLKDFQSLEYLSLGDNNFVCDCLLQDLVDVAAANNRDAECSRDILQEAAEFLNERLKQMDTYLGVNVSNYAKHALSNMRSTYNNDDMLLKNSTDYFVSQNVMKRYMPMLRLSYENIKASNLTQRRVNMRFFANFYRVLKSDGSSTHCSQSESLLIYDKLNGSSLKFQLLDYEDEHYWCFNETERMNFVQLQCQQRILVDNITKELHQLTTYVASCVGGLVAVFLVGFLIYWKRWHIQYYYTTLKSAALVSVASKNATDQFNHLAEQDPNLVYDIFLSYCENDRQWVLDELLPNVEETGDISICMHERDFQIGVTIVDNIISCMDRSRAFMLVISTNFLLSHWCQFEMYLAQHRLFDASKEHLIIVLLEDIPRSKRSKTLQYLMDVKTYIKWPTKPEERKFFWKRLKRSLEHIGLSPRDSHA